MQVLAEDTEVPIINDKKPITKYHLLLDILSKSSHQGNKDSRNLGDPYDSNATLI